jgi:hypothetical protein
MGGGDGRACGADMFFFPSPLVFTLIVCVQMLTSMVSPKCVSWV